MGVGCGRPSVAQPGIIASAGLLGSGTQRAQGWYGDSAVLIGGGDVHIGDWCCWCLGNHDCTTPPMMMVTAVLALARAWMNSAASSCTLPVHCTLPLAGTVRLRKSRLPAPSVPIDKVTVTAAPVSL